MLLSTTMDECSYYMGLVATKPVFGVSDKVRFKPACSATETSSKIEIASVSSLHIILTKKRITKALISHKTPGRQLKSSNKSSIPLQDD